MRVTVSSLIAVMREPGEQRAGFFGPGVDRPEGAFAGASAARRASRRVSTMSSPARRPSVRRGRRCDTPAPVKHGWVTVDRRPRSSSRAVLPSRRRTRAALGAGRVLRSRRGRARRPCPRGARRRSNRCAPGCRRERRSSCKAHRARCDRPSLRGGVRPSRSRSSAADHRGASALIIRTHFLHLDTYERGCRRIARQELFDFGRVIPEPGGRHRQ